jgi:uncharacterized protein YbjT (DUF2867 family)
VVLMRVAVTGARSKGGIAIAARLASAGAQVRTATHLRPPSPSAASAARGCDEAAPDCVAVDYLEPATLDPLFAGVDAAVLILPQDRTIVTMATNLVVAAERAHVGRLALISFLHADSGQGGPLLRWHHDAEQVVQRSAIPVTCLRPNYYMQNFLSAVRPSAELHSGTISYVDGRDVAEAVLTVLSQPGHEGSTHSLTGPRAHSVEDVIGFLRDEVGPPLTIPTLGWDKACFPVRRSSLSPQVQALCELWQAATEGVFATVTPDLERLIGRPGTTFERFARDHRGQCRTVVRDTDAGLRCA